MDLTIEKIDETYIRVICDDGIARELSDAFCFTVPGFQFTPSYKIGRWDGRIRLFNIRNRTIYAGLLPKILQFAQDRDYTIDGFRGTSLESQEPAQISSWAATLGLPDITPRDYQIAALRAVTGDLGNRGLIISPTGCHGEGDLVLKADGTMVPVETIKIGDFLVGPDGKPKEVLRLFNGEDELFEIRPKSNKGSLTVTKEHVLALKNSDNKKYGYTNGDFEKIEYVRVADYLEKSQYYKHCSKLFHNKEPIQTNNIVPDTKLSPYFIGLYLGDGSSYRPQITTMDREIADACEFQATLLNCHIHRNEKWDMHLNFRKNKKDSKIHPLFQEFLKLGIEFRNNDNRVKCENRFIPKDLFNTSISYRRELLAGLIDSDGHLHSSRHYFDLTFKSKQLADDVEVLAIGLGMVTSRSIKHLKKYNRDYFRVVIMGKTHLIPTRLPRKQAIERKDVKSDGTKNNCPYRTSFNIVPKGKGKFFGFEVEGHLYVTSSGIVTHNSGKSLLAYLLYRHYQKKTLLIVPTVGLVKQMYSDFQEYNCPDDIQVIYDTESKIVKSRLVIATWQGIFRLGKKWFDQFEMVIGDECHLFKATSLVTIMEKLNECPIRIGMTGTLDDSKVNELTLEGLFGSIFQSTTTAELIEKKVLADFEIQCLILKYSEEERKVKRKYEDEMNFLLSHPKRNALIRKLITKLDGNVLVMFQFVEKHGKELYESIKKSTNRPVYYISGEIKPEERERIRKEIDQQENVILVASSGTTSTGLNIVSLRHIIFTSPSKAKIKTLQSIGRVLRRSKYKTNATLWDLVDDLSWKSKKNYTLRHFMERVKIYAKETFKYKIRNIHLE